MAGNDEEWTSDQMIENANSWSLAGDVALLNRLKKFSESLLSETESVSANVDNLLNNLENVSLRLDLTKNEFQSLRNTQFIENRVYEDDETLVTNENKKEEKELTEEEKEEAIKESIVKGLKVIEKYFENIEVAVSDSEEEETEKSYILQPKDPYADRPLPYLVGSQEWYKKWHVGLLPSESESESEKEEEIFSSSDSEECLPKDKILGSETSSELDFANRNTGPVANSTFNDSVDPRREVFHSSDESSEQSNSLPVKAPISNEKFAEQLAAKLGDVISNTTNQNLEHSNRNPIKKMNQPTKYGNLFSDEPPPLDDLEDTVLPKEAHQGLFSGGHDLFSDSNEDELFWDQQNKTTENLKSSGEKAPFQSHPDDTSHLKVSKGLFDNSDSSGDDDMFTVAEKRKVKTVQPFLQPFKATVPFVDEQPPEITTKSDIVPSKKKPVGGVSIFGENSNIFSENSGKPGFESSKTTLSSQTTHNIEPKRTENVKKSIKKISLFDESSDEDIKTPKNAVADSKKYGSQQTTKKLSLFDDTEDIAPLKTQESFKRTDEKKKLSLFDDEDDFTISNKEDATDSKENKVLGILDEDPYQNVNLFRPTTKEIADKTQNMNKTSTENKKTVKKISLFEDDDDFLKEEEDIFASVPKKQGLFDEFDNKPDKTLSERLFEDSESEASSKTSADKETYKKPMEEKYSSDVGSKSFEVGDDLEKKEEVGKPTSGNKKMLEKSSTKSLFDDLETSGSSEDLFGSSNISQKGGDTKKVAEGLFTNTESSTSTLGLLESKKEDVDVKSLEKGVNKVEDKTEVLAQIKIEENVTKDIKNLGNLGEDNLFKTSSNFENPIDIFVNKKATVKQKGIFEDSDDDFFGDDNNGTEGKFMKAKNEGAKSNVLKGKNNEDPLNVETNYKEGIAEESKQDIVTEIPIGEDSKNVENNESVKIVNNSVKDEVNNSTKDSAGQTEDVLTPSKNNLLEKIKKNVAFLDSDSQSFSEDNYGFTKTTNESKQSASDESKATEGNKDAKENLLFKTKELEPVVLEEGDIQNSHVSSTDKSSNNADIGETSSEQNPHVSKNYTIPPPIDLFDPTPPPLDWDAGSDNSGESDTFSLSDGLLNQTNFNQSQARSSLFDEVPPSLDVNDSSGIVRDLNVTRVEADDSSFYPHASSSRRLSSDIFGEQQSQDSFFVTKNRTETSTQPGGSLEQIPENVENASSRIENLTPSGNLEDFDGSSVFEKSGNNSKDSENMDYSTPISEIKKPEKVSLFKAETKDSPNDDIFESKISDTVKKRSSLFEENRDLEKRSPTEKDDQSNEKSELSPIKTSPGKLQHNLKINVNALKPGAWRPQIRPVTRSASSDETDKSATSTSVGWASLDPPLISPVVTPKSPNIDEVNTAAGGDQNFENLSQTEVLHSATKERVRIPIKRRPSSRRARQEAVRKSMTDFSLYQNEENSSPVVGGTSENDKTSQSPSSSDKNNFLSDLNNKLRISNVAPKKETSEDDGVKINEDTPDVSGTSLVFNEKNEQQAYKIGDVLKNPVSKSLFDRSPEDSKPISSGISKNENKSVDILKSSLQSPVKLENEKSKLEEKSIFEDSFEDKSDIFKTTSKPDKKYSQISKKTTKDSVLFDESESDSSIEDLFSSSKKSLKKDTGSSVDKPPKLEEIPTKKQPKQSIFSDKSDSEGDSDLFGGKPKIPSAKFERKIVTETSKKASIFDDLEDSDEEDLFGPKTAKSRSGSGDVSESSGSVLGTRRVESKNVKIAGVKKLENKEVADFDPLSAL